MKHMQRGVKNRNPRNHTLVFEKSGKGKQLGFCSCRKFRSGADQFPKFGMGRSYECTRYELRVETGDIRPVLSLFRWKSRLDEFLGLLSSFVPIKADARRTLKNGN